MVKYLIFVCVPTSKLPVFGVPPPKYLSTFPIKVKVDIKT